ncbi:putative polysaccharide biosynthesis protein [Bacillus thermotolerans]|uniref:putative polysaccharide biosynthesis protein n=1 Tax=Bacillus thermotolerans TaxID=1221996 RepID=UPI00057D0CCB|nr:polysaccharide biosynthesis protein [Bacillus thermotolerans]KKB37537.1 Membrane protein [Bacillus thermotolerans]KKB39709.1 membrane protein involved in the export of O-antigen/teichoic acid/lipoteichoic acid [Bacillus thermotolerans]
MSSKLIRGTFILTLGTFISKFLGLFYVIPFYAIVGEEATSLYQYGYVPYTIFISLATAGIPLAVSKFIAKYNALEEYEVGRRLFRSGLVIMLLTGFLAFLAMYTFAPVFAQMVISDDEQIYTVAEVAYVIRAVSFALIIVPFMSIMRGFFQGHQSMGPSAVSQVIEQIARIVFLLGGSFLVLYVWGGTVVEAIGVATFAAFVGAVFGLLTLFWYFKKRKKHLDELLVQDKGQVQVSLGGIYSEIVVYAIPFIFVGIAIPLYQLVDMITFNRAMASIGLAGISDTLFGIVNFSAQKIVIIPVSLATAFAMTIVPLVTSSFVSREEGAVKRQLNQTFQVLLFLTVPAVVGIMLLAEPIYTVFYEHSIDGTEILRAYAPVAILFALFSVTAAILQGINEQRFTVFSLLFGILLKLSLNIPLIKLFQAEGAIYATAIGYGASIIINLLVIRHYAQYSLRSVAGKIGQIFLYNIIMSIVVLAAYFMLLPLLSTDSKMQSVVLIVICAILGAAVYFALSIRSGLADIVFGSRLDRLKNKLKRAKG